jgi:hypothetical protein
MLARITDRFNSDSLTAPGTVSDVPIKIDVPCSATSDPAAGGACVVNTTLDALLPGTVQEGDREVWELGRIEVYDGGSDGEVDTLDNDLFAVQGTFIP